MVEQQHPHLGALRIPAAVGAEGSGHECYEEEHSQPLFPLFPGNKLPFDPSRLHSSQRGMLQGGASRAAAGEHGGPPPPYFRSAVGAQAHGTISTRLYYNRRVRGDSTPMISTDRGGQDCKGGPRGRRKHAEGSSTSAYSHCLS